MLETDEMAKEQESTASSESSEQLSDLTEASSPSETTEDPEWSESIPSELPMDSGWDEIYSAFPHQRMMNTTPLPPLKVSNPFRITWSGS